MYTARIIKLLSNHRQPHRTELPQSLTLHAIATLIQQSLPPQQPDVTLQIEADLRELQAEGEVLVGKGNCFCMAPPVVLAEDEANVTGLLFRGDRAYLRLAHQLLETGQPVTRINLNPRITGFHRIKEQLQTVGIRLFTAANSVEHLPLPEFPKLFTLQGYESPNPFETIAWVSTLRQYVPCLRTEQSERWVPIVQAELSDRTLLKLPTGAFLWFEAGQFYELSPDTAFLSMFHLDQSQHCPLQIPWDETPGRLNLQRISLPGSYAQLLWRLSQSEPNLLRTRLFDPSNRPTAREALLKLGCTLV